MKCDDGGLQDEALQAVLRKMRRWSEVSGKLEDWLASSAEKPGQAIAGGAEGGRPAARRSITLENLDSHIERDGPGREGVSGEGIAGASP